MRRIGRGLPILLAWILVWVPTQARGEPLCKSSKKVESMVGELQVELACANSDFLSECSRVAKLGATAATVAGLISAGKAAAGLNRPQLTVRNLRDFERYTRLHIQRVEALGQELIKKYPHEFPGLTSQDVSTLLEHDRGKLAQLERVFKLYGKDGEKLVGREQAQWKKVVTEVGKVDAQVTREALRARGMIDSAGRETLRGQSYLRLERICDVVDRIVTSAEEFGRQEMYPFREIGRRGTLSPKDWQLGQHLLDNHSKLVGHLYYSRPGGRETAAAAEQLRLLRAAQGAEAADGVAAQVLGKGASRLVPGLGWILFGLYSKDLGCGTLHDEVMAFKSGSCELNLAFHPGLVSFLNQDASVIKRQLAQDPAKCSYIEDVYRRAREKPWRLSCRGDHFAVSSERLDLKIKTKQGRITEVEKTQFSSSPEFSVRFLFDQEGGLETVCIPDEKGLGCRFSFAVDTLDGLILYRPPFDPDSFGGGRLARTAQKVYDDLRENLYLIEESSQFCQGGSLSPERRAFFQTHRGKWDSLFEPENPLRQAEAIPAK